MQHLKVCALFFLVCCLKKSVFAQERSVTQALADLQTQMSTLLSALQAQATNKNYHQRMSAMAATLPAHGDPEYNMVGDCLQISIPTNVIYSGCGGQNRQTVEEAKTTADDKVEPVEPPATTAKPVDNDNNGRPIGV